MMGSCGNLASAAEPLSSGSEVVEELVSDKLTGIEAALDSPNSNENAGQMSSHHVTQHSGIEVDRFPGLCDKTSLLVTRDDQCTGKGGFECENLSEVVGSYLEEEGFSAEICPGNLQNTDDMALKLTSAIGSLDDPSDRIEAKDGMHGDVPLLKGVNLAEVTADDLLVMEAGNRLIPPLIITGDVCRNEMEATLESRMITEEVVLGQDGPEMNDQKASCPLETCASSVEENVHDVAEVETATCNMAPRSEASDMPTENILSSGYPDENSRKHENKKVSDLEIEVVEAIRVDMDSHELPSNETDGAADNTFPADSLCHAVLETVQGDDKSVKCLSSEEAVVEARMETNTVAKVEVARCTETPSFQIIEMPVEEKNVLVLNHEQMMEADSQNDGSTSLLQEVPYEQSGVPDCATDSDQLNEQESGGLLSGISTEMFSGIEDVKIDDVNCQMLPSKDDLGTSEGLHICSPLSDSSQMDGKGDSNGAPKTYLELVKEENAFSLDNFDGNGHQSQQLREVSLSFERLSEGTLGLQSCEPDFCVKYSSAKSSDDLDVQNATVAAATTSSAANNYSSKNNDKRKHDGRSECVPGTESPVVMTSSSRSSRVNKSGRKTQAKRASRHSRNANKVAPNYEALELIFKASKKKRSCCSKTPRSSTWGVMRNVSQHFEHIYGPGIEPAQKRGSRKVKIVRGNGKQSRNQSDGMSQPSKGNVSSSSNRIRLKVKMGKEIVMISEVVNIPASLGAFASGCCGGTTSDVAKLTNDVKEENQLECVDGKLDTGKTHHGDPLVNGDPNLIAKGSAQDGGSCLEPTPVEIGPVGVTVEDRYLGSETSPDSEVIDLMPEAQIGERHQEGINTVALDSSKSLTTCEDVLHTRKGKKKDKVPHQSSCRRKDKSLSGSSSSSKRHSCKVKGGESLDSGENVASCTNENCLSNSSRNAESINLSNESDLAFLKGSLCVESGDNTYPGQDVSIGSMDLEHLKNDLLSYEKVKGQKQVKSSKSGRLSGDMSKGVKSTKSRKGSSCKQKKDSEKSTSNSKVKEKGVYTANDHALAGIFSSGFISSFFFYLVKCSIIHIFLVLSKF